MIPDVAEPMTLVEQWLDEAIDARDRPNANTMTLATVGHSGRPSARIVLLKELDVARGFAVFYTNYHSRKAVEIGENSWCAAVMHWDRMGRQIRFEGPVVSSPAQDSDAYFATRPWRSQINAWASHQSEPIDDPSDLENRAKRVAAQFGLPDPFSSHEPPPDKTVPRPAFWGGYRLWLGAVELWASGRDRFHERARFERTLSITAPGEFGTGAWRMTRLQP